MWTTFFASQMPGLGGCILGLVASHPVTTRLCDFFEGTSRLSHSQSQIGLSAYTLEELTAKLAEMSKVLDQVPDEEAGPFQDEVAQLKAQLSAGDASDCIGQLTSEVFKLEARIQISSSSKDDRDTKDPYRELAELRARIAELEEQVKQPAEVQINEID